MLTKSVISTEFSYVMRPQQIFTIAIALFLLAACQKSPSLSVITTPSGEKIQIELAITGKEHQQGLMNREKLSAQHGMLFVFENPRPLSFWMKNTLIPLDLLYLDHVGSIIDIITMMPCPTTETQCPNYVSSKPAQYGLEINAAESKILNLKVGDVLQLPALPSQTNAD